MTSIAKIVRDDVNRLYRGFNGDCGRNAKLFSNPILSRPVNNDRFMRLQINPELGDGYWDILRLQEGFLMCVAQGKYKDLYDYHVTPPQNIITLRMVVSGELVYNGGDGQRIHLRQGQASLLSARPGVHDMQIDSDRSLASVTFHFHAERLAQLLGLDSGDVPELLKPFFEVGSNTDFCSMALTPPMSNAVLDLTNVKYDGVLRQRYFEAKAMELTCLFVDAARRNDLEIRGHSREKLQHQEPIVAAHKILAEHFVNPPSVDLLARTVGTNRTQLRLGFKRLYGQTISEYLIEKRMELARWLLLQPGNSIKSVALTVGYRYTANFSNAFKRYYGISPSKLRYRH